MAETINLEKTFKEKILLELSKDLGDLNVHETPRLTKIVLNIGVGRMVASRRLSGNEKKTDVEMIKDVLDSLASIGGQHPHVIRAGKSIAGFKLREGSLVGVRATLRGRRMYDFLGRLVHLSLPRTRDFRGISIKSVDQGGNLTIGIKDATVFPEMPQVNFNLGFEVTFVTNTKDRESAIELFKKLGIPFEKKE